MQVEENHDEIFDNQGDSPLIMDEDMEVSPSIPPLEFQNFYSVIGYAKCQVMGDSIC